MDRLARAPLARRLDLPALAPRLANLLLAVWLFFSAMLWRHAGAEAENEMAVALLVGTIAGVAYWVPALRFGSLFFAAWLFVSAVVFRHWSPVTLWHDAAVAVVMAVLALVPSRPHLHVAPRERAPA